MSIFLILPHQLFEIKHLDKSYKYIIWEHPHYFKAYNYNKKRILMHRASMKYYYDYLKSKGFQCKYVDFNDNPRLKQYLLFDPIDKIKLTGKYTIIESPNFLLNKEMYGKYRDKTKNFFFYFFYMWGKNEINVLPKVKSKDKYNRSTLPKNINIPEPPSNNADNKYIQQGISYINKHFKTNYGNTDDFMFPVTHKTAKKFLKAFIDKKLINFGKYQDAISQDHEFLFHSLLSSSINIGLLNPDDVIKQVLKKKAPINSVEGFVRQLFWREYQRYCYIYYNFGDKNYFGNKKKLTKDWYDGTLGIEPVDMSIQSAFDNGYLHHIERLMVVGNFMNLSGIHPKEGFRWFMEFSCDSYEWVMHQNVLEMVFFVSGGDTMRRPYISSSNYILKMSDYQKGEWSEEWDIMYKEFIKKHKKKLHKYRYYYKI